MVFQPLSTGLIKPNFCFRLVWDWILSYLPLNNRLLISNKSILVHPLENNISGSVESSALLAWSSTTRLKLWSGRHLHYPNKEIRIRRNRSKAFNLKATSNHSRKRKLKGGQHSQNNNLVRNTLEIGKTKQHDLWTYRKNILRMLQIQRLNNSIGLFIDLSTNALTDWMTDRQTDKLSDWLIDWLTPVIGWLIDRRIDWSSGSLTNWVKDLVIDQPT